MTTQITDFDERRFERQANAVRSLGRRLSLSAWRAALDLPPGRKPIAVVYVFSANGHIFMVDERLTDREVAAAALICAAMTIPVNLRRYRVVLSLTVAQVRAAAG